MINDEVFNHPVCQVLHQYPDVVFHRFKHENYTYTHKHNVPFDFTVKDSPEMREFLEKNYFIVDDTFEELEAKHPFINKRYVYTSDILKSVFVTLSDYPDLLNQLVTNVYNFAQENNLPASAIGELIWVALLAGKQTQIYFEQK